MSLSGTGGCCKKILIALAPGFFTSKEDKEHGAFRRFFVGQSPCQLEHGDTAGSIVIRAVVDVVSIDRLANANVVHMRGEQNDLIFQFLVAAVKSADHVACVPLLFAFAKKIEFAGDVLNVAAFVAGRFNADLAQLRSEIGGSKQFVMRSAGASLHGVIGKKFHGSADLGLVCAGFLGGTAERKQKRAMNKDSFMRVAILLLNRAVYLARMLEPGNGDARPSRLNACLFLRAPDLPRARAAGFSRNLAQPKQLSTKLLDDEFDHPDSFMKAVAHFLFHRTQCRLFPLQFGFQELLATLDLLQDCLPAKPARKAPSR